MAQGIDIRHLPGPLSGARATKQRLVAALEGVAKFGREQVKAEMSRK
jgi:hypothetical protein